MNELGDFRLQEYVPRPCEVCGKDAMRRVTFVLENARTNPASSAYGKDDISWCADDEVYACEEHARESSRKPPPGMKWCAIHRPLPQGEWRTREAVILLGWWCHIPHDHPYAHLADGFHKEPPENCPGTHVSCYGPPPAAPS